MADTGDGGIDYLFLINSYLVIISNSPLHTLEKYTELKP